MTREAADPLRIGHREFHSRLLIGTGKYRDFVQTREAIDASGAEIVTVAVRRVNLSDPSKERLTDHIDPKKTTFLPNTAPMIYATARLQVDQTLDVDDLLWDFYAKMYGPAAETMEGVYCSDAVNGSRCKDLEVSKACLCPTCAVWRDNSLTMQYYCADGSQIARERGSQRGPRLGM